MYTAFLVFFFMNAKIFDEKLVLPSLSACAFKICTFPYF